MKRNLPVAFRTLFFCEWISLMVHSSRSACARFDSTQHGQINGLGLGSRPWVSTSQTRLKERRAETDDGEMMKKCSKTVDDAGLSVNERLPRRLFRSFGHQVPAALRIDCICDTKRSAFSYRVCAVWDADRSTPTVSP